MKWIMFENGLLTIGGFATFDEASKFIDSHTPIGLSRQWAFRIHPDLTSWWVETADRAVINFKNAETERMRE